MVKTKSNVGAKFRKKCFTQNILMGKMAKGAKPFFLGLRYFSFNYL